MCQCQHGCSLEHPSVAKIINDYKNVPGSLIIVLQKAQKNVGYLSKDVIKQIAKGMGVSECKVYGVVTFYSQFHLTPQGQHVIRVCMGTACHVKGAVSILQSLENQLHIKAGETTKDLKFTLETVACIGACGLAPVITINEDTFAKLTPNKLAEILSNY